MISIGTSPRIGRLAALPLALGALALAGCGDDEGSGGGSYGPRDGDDVVSTTATDGGGTTAPELPVNDDPAAVQCTGPPKDVFDATATVGERLGEARRAARESGCEIRVAIADGEPRALTQDFRPDRVNVEVADGEIIEIVDIG